VSQDSAHARYPQLSECSNVPDLIEIARILLEIVEIPATYSLTKGLLAYSLDVMSKLKALSVESIHALIPNPGP
jgi:hypothetical protein